MDKDIYITIEEQSKFELLYICIFKDFFKVNNNIDINKLEKKYIQLKKIDLNINKIIRKIIENKYFYKIYDYNDCIIYLKLSKKNNKLILIWNNYHIIFKRKNKYIDKVKIGYIIKNEIIYLYKMKIIKVIEHLKHLL